MKTRELWQWIMNYEEFDRMPVFHWASWPETKERWQTEGMPLDSQEHQYFNAKRQWCYVGLKMGLFPMFEEKTIKETNEYKIFSDENGVIKQEWKNKSSIPHFIDYTLKTPKDWEKYKERLQPDMARYPKNIEKSLIDADSYEIPLIISTGSLMGWIRNWMGVENMSYFIYDYPNVYQDMIDTLADLACWNIEQVAPRMKNPPDMGFGWEDICGKSGPLISPDIFKKYVFSGCRKIRDKLEEHGVKLYGIDSDGYVEPLIKLWLDAGVNVQFPLEVGTWNADPMELRKKFGKELRMIGGFNKLELEKGKEAIDAEIDKKLPIMKEGGYVIMPDHLITPDTSLDNYKYYLERIRNLRF